LLPKSQRHIFEVALLSWLTFSGIVTSGQGNGKKFLELPWVKSQIQNKLGYTAYPGTLNIKLKEEDVNKKHQLIKKPSFCIIPVEGYCYGFIYKAALKGVQCAIVVPEVKDYPENILEIIAPTFLRDFLNLKNGDPVTVIVFD
jgi:riboflavin kinase